MHALLTLCRFLLAQRYQWKHEDSEFPMHFYQNLGEQEELGNVILQVYKAYGSFNSKA